MRAGSLAPRQPRKFCQGVQPLAQAYAGDAQQPQGEAPMADDLTNRGPRDRSRVNVNESYEVRYWCKEFSCTEQQLRDAVRRVGPMAADVRRALGK